MPNWWIIKVYCTVNNFVCLLFLRTRPIVFYFMEGYFWSVRRNEYLISWFSHDILIASYNYTENHLVVIIGLNIKPHVMPLRKHFRHVYRDTTYTLVIRLAFFKQVQSTIFIQVDRFPIQPVYLTLIPNSIIESSSNEGDCTEKRIIYCIG